MEPLLSFIVPLLMIGMICTFLLSVFAWALTRTPGPDRRLLLGLSIGLTILTGSQLLAVVSHLNDHKRPSVPSQPAVRQESKTHG